MALLTIAQGKAHLKVTSSDDDADITLKLAQAEAAVLDYCGSTAYWRAITVTWTNVTVPLPVQASILLMLSHLAGYETEAATWAAIERLVARLRDPALA